MRAVHLACGLESQERPEGRPTVEAKIGFAWMEEDRLEAPSWVDR
jgi:hypothetical protein